LTVPGGFDALPPVAELSTLTYVARRREDLVRITGRAGRVRCGALPGGSAACAAAAELFPGVASAVPDVLASSLANVNLVLHPPGAILGAAWVESTGGAFTFYVDAMTDGTGRVIDVLDAERRAVAAGFGHDLPSLTSEMALIGTVPPEEASDRYTSRSIASNWPIDPKIASSVSVPVAIIKAARLISPHNATTLGAYMPSRPTVTNRTMPVSTGTAAATIANLTTSVWVRLIGTGRRCMNRVPSCDVA